MYRYHYKANCGISFSCDMIKMENILVRPRLLLIPLLMQVSGWARQPEKPPCNEHNRGAVWPARANRDACHAVEMCTLNVWKYRWEPVTVPISRLAKDSKRKSACEATKAGGSPLSDQTKLSGLRDGR